MMERIEIIEKQRLPQIAVPLRGTRFFIGTTMIDATGANKQALHRNPSQLCQQQ